MGRPVNFAARRRIRERNKEPDATTNFITTEASSPWGSRSDLISAFTQIGLLALAFWGLVLTDAGERLAEMLSGDVAEARSSLANLRAEKSALDAELRSQRSEYLQNQLALLRSEAEGGELKRRQQEAATQLASVSKQLDTERQTMGLLSRQVALTVPARKQVICDSLILRLGGNSRLIDLGPIVPVMRWKQFKRKAGAKDFESWAALQAAWAKFSTEKVKAEGYADREIGLADYSVTMELLVPASLERLYRETKTAPKITPKTFDVGIDADDADEGSLASVQRRNPWDDVEVLFENDELSALDEGYAKWLKSLRQALNSVRPELDYAFPRYVPRRATFDQLEDDGIRYLRLLRGIDIAMSGMEPLCPDSF